MRDCIKIRKRQSDSSVRFYCQYIFVNQYEDGDGETIPLAIANMCKRLNATQLQRLADLPVEICG